MEDKYKRLLNDLTDQEFRVFISAYVFKNSQDQICTDLRKDKTLINLTCRQLRKCKEFEDLRQCVLDIFNQY